MRLENQENETGMRMRDPVQSVYNRQVAKCLTDIGELWDIPIMVEQRIKKAIEFTCKDVDKLKKISNPNGDTYEQEANGNTEA